MAARDEAGPAMKLGQHNFSEKQEVKQFVGSTNQKCSRQSSTQYWTAYISGIRLSCLMNVSLGEEYYRLYFARLDLNNFPKCTWHFSWDPREQTMGTEVNCK